MTINIVACNNCGFLFERFIVPYGHKSKIDEISHKLLTVVDDPFVGSLVSSVGSSRGRFKVAGSAILRC